MYVMNYELLAKLVDEISLFLVKFLHHFSKIRVGVLGFSFFVFVILIVRID